MPQILLVVKKTETSNLAEPAQDNWGSNPLAFLQKSQNASDSWPELVNLVKSAHQLTSELSIEPKTTNCGASDWSNKSADSAYWVCGCLPVRYSKVAVGGVVNIFKIPVICLF